MKCRGEDYDLDVIVCIFVCLWQDNAKTTELILINFGILIVLVLEKKIGYFLLQKWRLKGVK